MRITVLGCGSSTGVPVVGCSCKVCTSPNPKNKRTRVSVLLQHNGLNTLIDTSPDLRAQALRHGVTAIDSVVYTHDHADHTHGLDDLRLFNVLKNDSIDAHMDHATYQVLATRFSYAFQPKPDNAWYRPSLNAKLIPENPLQPFDVNGLKFIPFEQVHGKFRTLGFRVGGFAYSTDVNIIPEESFAALAGLDVWLVDCLRPQPSFSHSTLENTLKWIERIKPKLAVLTHMGHELDYDELLRSLPPNVIPAYDGLVLEC